MYMSVGTSAHDLVVAYGPSGAIGALDNRSSIIEPVDAPKTPILGGGDQADAYYDSFNASIAAFLDHKNNPRTPEYTGLQSALESSEDGSDAKTGGCDCDAAEVIGGDWGEEETDGDIDETEAENAHSAAADRIPDGNKSPTTEHAPNISDALSQPLVASSPPDDAPVQISDALESN